MSQSEQNPARDSRQELIAARTCSSPFDFSTNFVRCPSADSKQDTSPDMTPATTKTEYLKSGNRCLAESLGYRIPNIGDQEAKLIRADALTVIEKLTTGKPITVRPRQMLRDEIRSRLQQSVPKEYFLSLSVDEADYRKKSGWLCGDDTLARATANYITSLKSENESTDEVSKKRKRSKSAESTRSTERSIAKSEAAVSRALAKIEAWCDLWLEGKISEENWDKMEEMIQ